MIEEPLMSDTQQVTVNYSNAIGRGLYFCSRTAAMVGGLIMTALTIMVVASVLGRWLISSPIYGDFEMVEMGTAISVSLFLPYCHMNRGNVIVDLFLSWAPKRAQLFFDVIGSLALSLIAGALAWRMIYGGLGMAQYSETTYILALPLWWAFPFVVFSFGLLAMCAAYTAVHDSLRMLR
jgi:TRAP-type C4-dicarboxylate transport system permease small subunit